MVPKGTQIVLCLSNLEYRFFYELITFFANFNGLEIFLHVFSLNIRPLRDVAQLTQPNQGNLAE